MTNAKPRSLPGACTLMRRLCVACLLLATFAAVQASAATPDPGTGVLVVTPDRGFLGNEEVRDAFEKFAKGRNADLLYITDERSEKVLDDRLSRLAEHGARRVKVLPLVMSADDARWKLAAGWLEARKARGAQLAIARPYGRSYLAVEDLSARLRDVHTSKQHLLLLGYGAGSADAAAAMRRQLERMAGFASTLAPHDIKAVVYPARSATDATTLRKQFNASIKQAHGALVIPVAFAPRDDSMMQFSNWCSSDLPRDAQMVKSPLADTDALAQWMHRAAIEASLQFAPLDASQIGIVALAHGASWFWNQDIRNALAPIAARHKLAYAFSMADPPVVERAVRKLESENVKAVVVVRAFGMASSFRPAVLRMIGADVESGGAAVQHMPGMHDTQAPHHGDGTARTLAAPPRIRSDLPMLTVGGVGDDPLFAKALLANAQSVSKDPSRETVILVAHGQGADKANQRWLDILDSLARQMRAEDGNRFRAIEYATWREDWPDKRRQAVQHVRDMVKSAERDGGRALIVPARINEQGAADRYLKGLDFGWSKGFAQTPYFARWFEQEIGRGIGQLNHAGNSQATAAGRQH